jgi:hypothetical protein
MVAHRFRVPTASQSENHNCNARKLHQQVNCLDARKARGATLTPRAALRQREDQSKAKIRTEQEHGEFYLVVDGVRIAKRGQPGTPQAGTWISLVPGWEVGGTIGRIIITHDSTTIH